MGSYFLRTKDWAQSNAAINSANFNEIKNNSRKKRDRSAQLGDALLTNTLEKSAETVSEEAPVTRACPSEANADFNSWTQDNQPSNTMKPIGEYPSLAEYKSAGLKPPSKRGIDPGKLPAHPDEDGDDLMTDTPFTRPITPVEDEMMDDQIEGVDQQSDKFTDGLDLGSLNTSIESVPGEKMGVEVNVEVNEEGPNDTNLASPISELFNPHLLPPSSTHTSPSPFDTPVETPVEELADPVMAPSKRNKKKTPAPAADNPLQNPQSPPATAEPTTELVKPAGFDPANCPGRNYVAVLKYLPQPTSTKYDVPMLRTILETAIIGAKENNEDDIAVSLLHLWSKTNTSSGLRFMMSLLHNMSITQNTKRDHNLQLALQTIILHDREDTIKWYKNFIESHARAGLLGDSDDEASAPRAKAVPDKRKIAARRLRDLYRDTSGSKLEEAFVTGKTNTAPIKRPKKPCPAHEAAFKRRLEWEADQDHEKTVRSKRARFREAQTDQALPASISNLRPRRQEVEIPQPDIHSVQDVISSPEPEVQDRRKQPATPKSAPAKGRSKPRQKGKRKVGDPPLSQAKIDANMRHNRERFEAPLGVRSQSPPRDTADWPKMSEDSDGELSNSVYSKHANSWKTSIDGSRHGPNEMERGIDNVDDCCFCGDDGELTCCETCQNAFHIECLAAVDRTGEDNDEWFCPTCDAKHVFTTYIMTGSRANKTEFAPSEQIQSYYLGVGQQVSYRETTGPEWSLNTRGYKEIPLQPRLTKPPKKNGKELEYVLYNDESLLKLTENGHVVLCSVCCRSSDNVRPIIKCDYCPRRFHLDCLDPPLTHPPNPKKGWICPNHPQPDDKIRYVMVNGRIQERRVRESKKVAVINADILPIDDGATIFDEEMRESRLRVPAGEVAWNFIKTVKENHQVKNEENIQRVKDHFVNITNLAVGDLVNKLTQGGPDTKLPDTWVDGWMDNFRSLCDSEARRARTGLFRDTDADAADTLLSLAAGNQTATQAAASQPPQPIETQTTVVEDIDEDAVVEEATVEDAVEDTVEDTAMSDED